MNHCVATTSFVGWDERLREGGGSDPASNPERERLKAIVPKLKGRRPAHSAVAGMELEKESAPRDPAPVSNGECFLGNAGEGAVARPGDVFKKEGLYGEFESTERHGECVKVFEWFDSGEP